MDAAVCPKVARRAAAASRRHPADARPRHAARLGGLAVPGRRPTWSLCHHVVQRGEWPAGAGSVDGTGGLVTAWLSGVISGTATRLMARQHSASDRAVTNDER